MGGDYESEKEGGEQESAVEEDTDSEEEETQGRRGGRRWGVSPELECSCRTGDEDGKLLWLPLPL